MGFMRVPIVDANLVLHEPKSTTVLLPGVRAYVIFFQSIIIRVPIVLCLFPDRSLHDVLPFWE